MATQEQLTERMVQLIADAPRLESSNQYGYALHITECAGWIAAAQNVVHLSCPNPNAYRRSIDDLAAKQMAGSVVHVTVGSMRRVLEQLLHDIRGGLLGSILDQARAEVFDDFLDAAKDYHRNGKKNEAGVISGIVFEDTLRKLCDKLGIPQRGEKLDELISVLTKGGVVSATKGKRARAAAHVRTKAAHAQWDEFDQRDVEATIAFADELILLLESGK